MLAAHNMASISELTTLHSAVVLHDNNDKLMSQINALIKATYVSVEPFWPGVFAMALANINTGSLVCDARAGGPSPGAGAVPAGLSFPSTTALAEQKKVDDIGFGLFD